MATTVKFFVPPLGTKIKLSEDTPLVLPWGDHVQLFWKLSGIRTYQQGNTNFYSELREFAETPVVLPKDTVLEIQRIQFSQSRQDASVKVLHAPGAKVFEKKKLFLKIPQLNQLEGELV